MKWRPGRWRAWTAGGTSTRPARCPPGTWMSQHWTSYVRHSWREEPSRADQVQPAPGMVRQHLAGGRDPRTGPAGARPDRVSTPRVLGCSPVDRCTQPTIREKASMTSQTTAPAPATAGTASTLAIEARDLVKTYPKEGPAPPPLRLPAPPRTVF